MLRMFSGIAFLLGLLAVIVLSVIPAATLPDIAVSDKAEHMAAYTALALAGGIAFRGRWPLWMLAVGLVFLGLSLEFVQAFIPSRTASGYDMLANLIGIAAGSVAAVATTTIVNNRPRTLG
jgi:VanZ family protein